MKDRLSEVLAWFAFIHSALLGFMIVISWISGTVAVDIQIFDAYLRLTGFYMLGQNSVLFHGPIIWIGLYITTGNAGLPPWKRQS